MPANSVMFSTAVAMSLAIVRKYVRQQQLRSDISPKTKQWIEYAPHPKILHYNGRQP